MLHIPVVIHVVDQRDQCCGLHQLQLGHNKHVHTHTHHVSKYNIISNWCFSMATSSLALWLSGVSKGDNCPFLVPLSFKWEDVESNSSAWFNERRRTVQSESLCRLLTTLLAVDKGNWVNTPYVPFVDQAVELLVILNSAWISLWAMRLYQIIYLLSLHIYTFLSRSQTSL